MNDLAVVMPCTEESGSMREYLGQLKAAEISAEVVKIESFKGADSLGHQISFFRKMAKQLHNWDKIIFSDAFDVEFYGAKKDVLEKIPDHAVVMAAERNCYPDDTLRERIPGETPWKFSNGGLLAGKPSSFLRFCDMAEAHPFYHPDLCNQTFFNQLLFRRDLPSADMKLDNSTNLFYCLYGEHDELQFDKGIPINRVCKTRPNFIHANGKWPTSAIRKRRDVSIGAAEEKALYPLLLPFAGSIELKLCRECRDRILCESN